MGNTMKQRVDKTAWEKVARKMRADLEKAATSLEKADVLAEGFAWLLRESGFAPLWVGVGTALVIEFATREEADACALWCLPNALQVDHVCPADDDLGPCVVVNL